MRNSSNPPASTDTPALSGTTSPAPRWPQATGTPALWESGAAALRAGRSPRFGPAPARDFSANRSFHGLGW